MHFVDRSICANAPTSELAQLHLTEHQKWLDYKAWLRTKTPPEINRPASKWTKDTIRDPLTELFKNNCCYCGNYSDKNNDGEVDHFFPKELDNTANSIYAWSNYVWACHPCNNKKRNHYPLINPCDENETSEIYFHTSDGRYLLYSRAPKDIQDKFKLTDEQTYMNGKMCPQRRKNVHRQLETIYLNDIKLFQDIYDVEFAKDRNSDDSKEALRKLEKSKQSLKDFLEAKDFILLKMLIIEKFKRVNASFPYSYSDFV